MGLVLLVSLVLVALGTALPTRSHGSQLANGILCAMKGGGCAAGELPGTGGPELPGPRQQPRAGDGLGLRKGFDNVRGFRFPPPAQQTPDVPCEAYWCDFVVRNCEKVYKDRAGEAFCKARAAVAAKPNALTEFLHDRAAGCVGGAVGAKAFQPFADELLRGEATKSVKNARRALEQGFKRAKDEVFKGKVKPGLIGCIGGAIGI